MTEKTPAHRGQARGRSLSQRIYTLLKTMIENGRIKGGERVMETQVAKAFSVSRSPARAALIDLRNDGLLMEIDGGQGYTIVSAIASPRPGELAVLDSLRLDTTRQWEHMYTELEKEIAMRVLFGSVQINEQTLGEHFGVSRTVTRDVLARMNGVGLVVKDRAGHWHAHKVTPERIGHLYELRWILEPQALLQAYPLMPAGEVERAREQTVNVLSRSPIASAEFDRVEVHLHSTLLSFCPNLEILAALERTQLLFVPTRYLTDPLLAIPMELIEDALKEHLHILQCLLEGQPEKAAQYLVDHLKVAQGRWLQRFEIAARVADLKMPNYLSVSRA
ncbi:GntR family transcriptional regulator [Afifella sp. IM 167]|uniref:GntR family transcriptional regulator n=1 Tax=Afifella sp. IM 167 TaxID=2033586 RepID=UPI001CCED827|nr:GntR family transcriptional regulator [Afifella sp. IM 167]MBZ8134366.1 GntR family transcriptional regulator [Afifella sp. IM 167]